MAGWRSRVGDPRVLRAGVAGLLLVAAAALFLKAWLPVLTGERVLIGADVLNACCLPWRLDHPMAARNPIVGDGVLEVLPWQQVSADAIRRGHLPLWNPYALSGKPLLGSGLPGVLSPFNLLAVPFPAAVGLSLGMLVKVLAAGLGIALFLRLLGARAPATVIGGVAYATSSFTIVWLAWPHSGVTAVMPWAFAAAEWCLSGGGLRAHAALAAAVAAQFLAGHAGTSAHLAFGLALYCAVRWALGSRDWRALAGLAGAGLLGTLAASVQLLPFVENLRQSALVTERTGFGLFHLAPVAALTWLAPNAHGTPIYDGGAAGFRPNYNEATGFATVAMLALTPVGAAWAWANRRPAGVALCALLVAAAGTAYGPLTPLAGSLPLLASEGSSRMTALVCLAVAALGGLGVEAVWRGARPRPAWAAPAGRVLGLAAGAAGLAGVVAGVALLARLGGPGVERLLPAVRPGYVTFWLALGGLALVAALGFAVAGLVGRAGPVAVAGIGVLVLGEAWLFAPHYHPLVPTGDVAAPTPLTSWLQEHTASAPIAATGTIVVPDSSTLYGIADVRTYDAARSQRSRMFWTAADPGYHDEQYYTWLARPGVDWLAAAGVRYVLTEPGRELPGTTPRYEADGVSVAEVSGARPFAWSAAAWSSASGPDQARSRLLQGVAGPPVLEGVPAHAAGPGTAPAAVAVVSREPGAVELAVSAPAEEAVVVEQSWAPGWSASIDGRAADLHPANLAFQGLVVPAGEHRVRLSYLPASVSGGLALSGLALVVIALLALPTPSLRRLVEQRHLKVRPRVFEAREADP